MSIPDTRIPTKRYINKAPNPPPPQLENEEAGGDRINITLARMLPSSRSARGVDSLGAARLIPRAMLLGTLFHGAFRPVPASNVT
jgi:hypothetical protein